jgi:hypothetical protein
MCGETRALIKAHIIPRSFFKQLNDGSGPLKVASDKLGTYPRRSPTGVHDNQLVCRRCEELFGPWDGYAQKLLLEPYKDSSYIEFEGQRYAYVFKKVDYRRLKLFFVSLLWQASTSAEGFYERIRLGPFEDLAKQMILENDPGETERFAVSLARFEDPLGRTMLSPDRTKFYDINYCRFFLAGYIAYIKVDRRKSPDFLQEFLLCEERPFAVILRDFRTSKELTALRRVAKIVSTHSKRQR